jgi:hypothetical protein
VRAVRIRDNKNIVNPTREAIRRRDYPIVRNLSFITPGEPNGGVKAFLEYLKSRERGGYKQVVEKSGYIPCRACIKGNKQTSMGRIKRSIEKSGYKTFCGSTARLIHSSNACGWVRNFIDVRTYLFAGS